ARPRALHSFPTRRSSDLEWLMNYSDMHPALFAYLHSIGQIPDEEDGGGQLNWPEGWENFVLPDSNLDDVPRLDEDLKSLFPDPRSEEYTSELQSRENLVC